MCVFAYFILISNIALIHVHVHDALPAQASLLGLQMTSKLACAVSILPAGT